MLELQLNTGACEQVASAHRLGKEHYARRVVKSLFDAFLQVEERFSANKESTEQEKIDSMRSVKVSLPHCAAGTGQTLLAKSRMLDRAALWTDSTAAHVDCSAKLVCSSVLDLLQLPPCLSTQVCAEQDALVQEYSSNLGELVDIVVSHQGLPMKVALISQLLETLVLPVPDHYQNHLRRMAALGALHAHRQFLLTLLEY